MRYISHTPFADAHALVVANHFHAGRLEEATRARKRRQAFLYDLATLAENGEIAVVESGMDCDCVQYDNKVRIMAADKATVEAYCNKQLDYADGPMHFRLEMPSVAKSLEHTSRDLAMEAHEDGHDHVVYPR